MNLQVIFTLLGGLGLFLFGIRQMEDGLKYLAGSSLKRAISILTRNRVTALLVGFVLTTLMQSSSATTTMVVGLIDAGFVTLTQSVGFILGCHIGSTTTGQIISFKLDQYGLPVLGLGVILFLFSSHEKFKSSGLTLLGFGMLFFGMFMMKGAIEPLKQAGYIEQWFSICNSSSVPSIMLGIMIAVIATAIVQSSGATIGVIIALGSTGVIKNFSDTIPLILGCNIGTCITALLASLQTGTTARKAAVMHLLISGIVTIVVLVTFRLWVWLIPYTAVNMSRQIANAHTLFNLVSCVLFLPFTLTLVRLLNRVWPEKKETIINTLQRRAFRESENLGKQYLSTPQMALLQVRKEIGVMAYVAYEMISDVKEALLRGKIEVADRVARHEDIMDALKRDIQDYLVLLTQEKVTSKQGIEIEKALEASSELERVGDHIESMLWFARLVHEGTMVLDDNNRSRIQDSIDSVVRLSDLVKDWCSVDRIIFTATQVRRHTKVARDYYDGCINGGSWNLISDLSFKELIVSVEKLRHHYLDFAKYYYKWLEEVE